jgi:5-methylcytosine-specific restriction protein A
VKAGEFNPKARAAIYEIGQGRCIGCGRSDLTAQHRRPRGMGGTSEVSIGHPANGVPLCGDGVRGCHGWAEKNRTDALLLGWLLGPHEPAVGTPFWSRIWGWRAWHVDDEDGFPSVVYVDEDEDLEDLADRQEALRRFMESRPPPTSGLKSQR